MLLAAWVWQDAIPSYICVNPCYLWETLLCKKFLCVPWVLWEYSLPRISRICTDGLVALIRPQNSQKFWGAVGCVGMAGCHTLLHLCKSVLSVGATSQPEGSVCSVRSVGDIVSHGIHRIHRSFIASVLPRNSQNSQKFCCVGPPTEFTEFTEVLLRWFSHRIHGIHRSFIASHSSINLESVLWEVLLCQKVPCVPCVLWAISLLVLLVQFLL